MKLKSDRVIRGLQVFFLIFMMQYGCGSGRVPASEKTDYEQFTLSPVLRVNPQEGTVREPSYLRMPAIQRDGKGTLRVAWTQAEDSQLFLQSMDKTQQKFSDPQPAYQDGLNTWDDFPTLLVDPKKDRLYLSAWRKGIMWGKSQVRRSTSVGGKFNFFSRSEDGGKSWGKERSVSTGDGAFNPVMVCDPEGRIYIAWRDERSSNADVYINRSLDSGETWLEKEIRISPGEPGKGVANFINILPDPDGKVCVIFSYAEMDKACALYAVTSKDYGATWEAPVRINDNPELHMDLPRAVRRGAEITMVWHFTANTVNAVYLDQSKDGGKTWNSDRIIFANPNGLSLIALEMDDQKILHLLWQNYSKEGTSIRYMRSEDFGSTWLNDQKTKGNISQGKKLDMDALRTGVKGNTLAAVWKQVDSDQSDQLMINFSRDSGKTWLEESIPFATSLADSGLCSLAQVLVDQDSLWLLWVRTSKGNKADLHLRSLTFKK